VQLARRFSGDERRWVALASGECQTRARSRVWKSGMNRFIEAAIVASGPVPKREVMKWFAWPREEVEESLTALLARGDVHLVDGAALEPLRK
jgi:hypothetical protein